VTLNESILNDNPVLLSTEQPKEETTNIIEFQSLSIDERMFKRINKFLLIIHIAPETIEADFTDSVSLILHQLQQDEKLDRHSLSITLSEEDSDDDDDDELDTESVVESIMDQTHRSSTSSIIIPLDLTKSIQTDLSFHVNDNISFTKVQLSTPINKKKPAIQPVKKSKTYNQRKISFEISIRY
jgi:hypothetical protein